MFDRSVEPSAEAVQARKSKEKTKMVAWFVSHCFTQSRREAYVQELRKKCIKKKKL